METMTSYPVTPQTQLSHVRHNEPSLSRTNAAAIAQQATRNMQAAESQQPQLSGPASQESFASMQSNGSSNLQSLSSNVSQISVYSDLASSPKKQYGQANAELQRARTPEDAGTRRLPNDEYALASPMSVDSPVTNGAKRTASGHVKNAPSIPSTPSNAIYAGGRRSRAESLSSTGSRAGELAATLKARLGYAMVKVQNGWEHKSLAEVEQLAAHKISPHRRSMSHVDYGKRPVSSGLSNGTARLSMYEAAEPLILEGPTSPPSKRHSGAYAAYSNQTYAPANTAPRLQPPADIRPTDSSIRYHAAAASPSQPRSSNAHHHHNHAMSPPRTPLNNQPRRPPTLRTDTQTAEAERDALQALFQLGSPHTASQVSRHAASQASSSSQASPLRTEFATPARRVTFARSDSEGGSTPASSADGQSA